MLALLTHRVNSLEMRSDTMQNSFDRIQNLIYERIPTFERRIT